MILPSLTSQKIIEGGSGVWGTIPMTPHANLSQADAEQMVKYIFYYSRINNMKFLLLAASIVFTAVSCQQRNNTANTGNAALQQDSASASSANADTGWQNLFNGHSLAGWHTYGKTTAGNAWKADSGAIHLDASASEGRGDLITNNEYGDFDLKLEWKISPNGNSGILFYVKEDTSRFDETYKSGPEMQVLDNNGHPDGKNFKTPRRQPLRPYSFKPRICQRAGRVEHGGNNFKKQPS